MTTNTRRPDARAQREQIMSSELARLRKLVTTLATELDAAHRALAASMRDSNLLEIQHLPPAAWFSSLRVVVEQGEDSITVKRMSA
jgi:hypothetical protein